MNILNVVFVDDDDDDDDSGGGDDDDNTSTINTTPTETDGQINDTVITVFTPVLRDLRHVMTSLHPTDQKFCEVLLLLRKLSEVKVNKEWPLCQLVGGGGLRW